jgi:threonine dehydratase
MELVSLDDVAAAAKSIEGVAVRTPLLPWPAGDGLLLKPENLQPVGAFKIRGAQHAVARLPAGHRAAGVVTHSSGNHGQALAYAARAFGVPCVVVMPDAAPGVKVAAVRALGAEVVLVPPARRAARMAELVAERGLCPVPPYDHRDVIAGQGTVGLEILADLSEVDVVLVPVGGGGLASGVATAVKALRPSAAVVGVEPQDAADARDSLAAGTVVTWPVERAYRTIADALRTPLSELTLAHLSARLDGIVTVSDDEIRDAVGRLARTARLVAEPAGAAAAAAYLHRRAELPGSQPAGRAAGLAAGLVAGRTVAVVSGGNIEPALLRSLL